MGLFSFIGGLFGGGSQKKASQQATDAMVAAYNRGIDVQDKQYQQTRQDYMPYTQAGNNAVTSLDGLIRAAYGDPTQGRPTVATGEMTSAQADLESRLKGTPLYQSLFRNGEEAILQNASATGGLRGGNTARGLADFGSDTLLNVYNNQLSNLYGLANLGIGATGSVANAGANNANNTTALLGNIGQAQAANYLTKGGINARNWQNAGSFLDGVAGAFGGGGGVAGALKSIF